MANRSARSSTARRTLFPAIQSVPFAAHHRCTFTTTTVSAASFAAKSASSVFQQPIRTLQSISFVPSAVTIWLTRRFANISIRKLSKSDREIYQNNPHRFKLRYIFREFTLDFLPLQRKAPELSRITDLSRIRASSHLLGLILTYNVNLGLSLRQTALILREVHGVACSHVSVKNYVTAVAKLIDPFVRNYDYQPSNQICGDETYIRVAGAWHYVYLVIDCLTRRILAFRVSAHRDTAAAIRVIDDVLTKFKKIPENLTLVFDGHPLYLLAQYFFAQHDIHFDIVRVLGLKNDDEVSRQYRPLKQTMERYNRTFKRNYRDTNGFACENGSAAFLTNQIAYYNFLRPHQAVGRGQVPVLIPALSAMPNMPARWSKLIELAQQYILDQQSA
jgi:transposase-like protein